MAGEGGGLDVMGEGMVAVWGKDGVETHLSGFHATLFSPSHHNVCVTIFSFLILFQERFSGWC